MDNTQNDKITMTTFSKLENPLDSALQRPLLQHLGRRLHKFTYPREEASLTIAEDDIKEEKAKLESVKEIVDLYYLKRLRFERAHRVDLWCMQQRQKREMKALDVEPVSSPTPPSTPTTTITTTTSSTTKSIRAKSTSVKSTRVKSTTAKFAKSKSTRPKTVGSTSTASSSRATSATPTTTTTTKVPSPEPVPQPALANPGNKHLSEAQQQKKKTIKKRHEKEAKKLYAAYFAKAHKAYLDSIHDIRMCYPWWCRPLAVTVPLLWWDPHVTPTKEKMSPRSRCNKLWVSKWDEFSRGENVEADERRAKVRRDRGLVHESRPLVTVVEEVPASTGKEEGPAAARKKNLMALAIKEDATAS